MSSVFFHSPVAVGSVLLLEQGDGLVVGAWGEGLWGPGGTWQAELGVGVPVLVEGSLEAWRVTWVRVSGTLARCSLKGAGFLFLLRC